MIGLRRVSGIFGRRFAGFGWNIIFPFLIILGFSLMFTEDRQVLYKIGVIGPSAASEQKALSPVQQREWKGFRSMRYLEFIPLESEAEGMNKLSHHRLDLVLDPAKGRYWVSRTSPRGYIAERMLQSSGQEARGSFVREAVRGEEIPYIEWLFPGILGMNIMFSALFGVGYVVVRYRKNGVLKRMSVTPLRPWEFLTAQVLSRMFLILATTVIVYAGCSLIFGFTCHGSYLSLVLIFALGGFSMVTLGLVVASRSSSEEFAGGVLNVISWPMMFLSEVWFSLEGANPWIKKLSLICPLTPLTTGARRIMNDGASLGDIGFHILTLTVMSAVFLAAGAFFFRWQKAD